MVGGWFLMESIYIVGFIKMGKIIVLKVYMFMEGGWFLDLINVLYGLINMILKKYNYGIFDVKYILCWINNVFKIIVWVFGDCEGLVLVDVILN